MERLARLLPFRQFGRLRHLRNLVPCAPIEASGATPSLFDTPEPADSHLSTLPSALPAFARVSLNSGLNTAEPARRAPVRVLKAQAAQTVGLRPRWKNAGTQSWSGRWATGRFRGS